mgnify:CR=1 FL=1
MESHHKGWKRIASPCELSEGMCGYLLITHIAIHMADREDKNPENVDGKFFVDSQCIDCDLCRETAPENFKREEDEGYSYVYKQPENKESVPSLSLLCEERKVGARGVYRDAAGSADGCRRPHSPQNGPRRAAPQSMQKFWPGGGGWPLLT